ncbi:hypothetical protein OMP40_09220 [Cohnella rhizosphaerae]|uniref:Uncharacterized protein n=1 Tax=Cohnella rhizosphaerae TaxID=1457232 RepID=A0A9X4KSM6_9BACL|nr:hypothetical protein [Cohnella rhizosphaerae]MDG0809506.1 hypothetical protein [Cohnella rhizosphaerae]
MPFSSRTNTYPRSPTVNCFICSLNPFSPTIAPTTPEPSGTVLAMTTIISPFEADTIGLETTAAPGCSIASLYQSRSRGS